MAISRCSCSDFHDALSRPGIQILDIRTPPEYRLCHIPGATSVDYHAPDFLEEIQALPRDGEYAIYCRVGHRSGNAVLYMEALGFKTVWELRAGIEEWEAKGLPTTRQSPRHHAE